MRYADQQVISFTLDPTDRVVEFTSAGEQAADTLTVPLIGWAVVSQATDSEILAHTSLEPVVLKDDQYAVTVSSILSAQAAGVSYRIRHRT
ncbi:MAG: hypothetical protein ABWX73_08950 [Marmoricola sp.]